MFFIIHIIELGTHIVCFYDFDNIRTFVILWYSHDMLFTELRYNKIDNTSNKIKTTLQSSVWLYAVTNLWKDITHIISGNVVKYQLVILGLNCSPGFLLVSGYEPDHRLCTLNHILVGSCIATGAGALFFHFTKCGHFFEWFFGALLVFSNLDILPICKWLNI